jgi:predicted 3-demethylubiquinone-9 3-methyltransferase (glyoxalase superfamily)
MSSPPYREGESRAPGGVTQAVPPLLLGGIPYVSAFADSALLEVERFGSEDEGERGIKHARFQVAGRELVAMDSAGPHHFTFTPAISLVVECDREDELDAAWARLADGATVLMPLQAYDFSPKFGWLQDRFGVSWQIRLV